MVTADPLADDSFPICDTCGKRHVRDWKHIATGKIHRVATCTGHVRFDRTGYVKGQHTRPRLPEPRPCQQIPSKGQVECHKHGGAKKEHREAGARRRQLQEAQALMQTLGEPINDGRDYAEVIADRVAARRGHVAWLHARVAALEPEALTWGLTKRKTAVARSDAEDDAAAEKRNFAGTDEGDTHEAKPSVWFVLYEQAARDLEKLCIEAIRVGVEQRRLQLDERVADRFVAAIDGIVTALGHDPNNPETAKVVARHLELVA